MKLIVWLCIYLKMKSSIILLSPALMKVSSKILLLALICLKVYSETLAIACVPSLICSSQTALSISSLSFSAFQCSTQPCASFSAVGTLVECSQSIKGSCDSTGICISSTLSYSECQDATTACENADTEQKICFPCATTDCSGLCTLGATGQICDTTCKVESQTAQYLACIADSFGNNCVCCKNTQIITSDASVGLYCLNQLPISPDILQNIVDNVPVQKTDNSNFEWTNQAAWKGQCQTGQMQSPIDINPKQISVCPEGDFNYIEFQCAAPHHQPGQGPMHSINVYDFVTAFFYKKFEGNPSITGGATSRKIEFHSPSQHTIKGNSYDLEMQIVLDPVDRALWEKVIAESNVYQQTSETPESIQMHINQFSFDQNKVKNVIISYLFSVDEQAESLMDQMQNLHFGNFGCTTKGLFYRYTGSLTVPPCTEGVQWFVARRPLKILQTQLDMIKLLITENNNRQIQAINERTITLGGNSCHQN